MVDLEGIVLYWNDLASHIAKVETILKRKAAATLRLKLKKRVFSELKYRSLGIL